MKAMELKELVCGVEVAALMVAAGVKRKSIFYHVQDIKGGYFVGSYDDWPGVLRIPAYTVGELGAMLPDDSNNVYHARKAVSDKRQTTKEYLTSPDLIGYMVLWLLESGWMLLEEIK